MSIIAALLICLGSAPIDRPGQGEGASSPKFISVGWNDELNHPDRWSPLSIDNKAKVEASKKGRLTLSLGQRPADWPYTYQWSGVQQKLHVDLARFPVVAARLNQVTGYAHLDIDVLDAAGKVVKGFRSTTLDGPGVVWTDLSKSLDPAIYTLNLRLIVGGDNSGCSVAYDWVRFVSVTDGPFLLEHPDYQNVRLAPRQRAKPAGLGFKSGK
jgi:hypothetical protein